MRHVAFRIPFERMVEVENYLNEVGQAVMGFDYGPRCRALFINDPDGHQIELIGYADGVFTS
jgi:catechol 2,3-dioxygenase-like lactoylglutathione lyase family enzyme